MIISIDDTPHVLDVAKIARRIKEKYNASGGGNALPLLDGKTLDIGKKSILRLAVKSMLVPIVLPLITTLAQKYDYELSPHVKHEDLIDYIVNNSLDLVAVLESEVHIYVSTQVSDIGVKSINSFSTTERKQLNTKGEERAESYSQNDEDTGWRDDILRWENGHGENKVYQGDNTQED